MVILSLSVKVRFSMMIVPAVYCCPGENTGNPGDEQNILTQS